MILTNIPWKIILISKYNEKFTFTYYRSSTEYLSFDEQKYDYQIYNEKTQGDNSHLHQMQTMWRN